MKRKSSREFGMTLIELIVVVALVAILGMIAFPSYSNFQERARRVDAVKALEHIAILQERYYATNHTYINDLTRLGIGDNLTESGFYVISVPAADPTGFIAVAVPAPGSRQLKDIDCQQFTITDLNVRSAVPDPDGKCW